MHSPGLRRSQDLKAQSISTKNIITSILQITTTFLFIILVYHCTITLITNPDAMMSNQNPINPNNASTAENKIKRNLQKSINFINLAECCVPIPNEHKHKDYCHDYCQTELAEQMASFSETIKIRELLEIKKYTNRANIYEAKIYCLYPWIPSNFDFYDALLYSLFNFQHKKPLSPNILLQDQPKENDEKWRFNPHLTVLHLDFNQQILPEAFVFEYPTGLRELFKNQGLKIKIVGINHNSTDSLLPKGLKAKDVHLELIDIDEFFFEKEETDSIYHQHYSRTILGRICTKPNCFNMFRAIRFEIFSDSPSYDEFFIYR